MTLYSAVQCNINKNKQLASWVQLPSNAFTWEKEKELFSIWHLSKSDSLHAHTRIKKETAIFHWKQM